METALHTEMEIKNNILTENIHLVFTVFKFVQYCTSSFSFKYYIYVTPYPTTDYRLMVVEVLLTLQQMHSRKKGLDFWPWKLGGGSGQQVEC
jgi:hypothetical protein